MHRYLALLLIAATAPAAEWPPTPDSSNTATRSLDGRTILRYTHGPRGVWGYPETGPNEWTYRPSGETGKLEQNSNSFYLVAPRKERKNAPLCVVLHSANRTAFDYLGYQFLNRKIDASDDPASVLTRASIDCYVLFPNSTNAEWYGWSAARRESTKYASAPTPSERRIFDTIEWVAGTYAIDRNRIYLNGVSMGGCGTLALGLPHGDIFAAVAAYVPAGTEYLAYRMGFPARLAAGASEADKDQWLKRVSGFGRPDPPVLVDLSAPNDDWSKTQPALLEAAEAGRVPLILGWGLFGHSSFGSRVAKFPLCDIVRAYPWTEIRKNAAYPVFTNATSDQRAPWRNAAAGADESGQMNAYFRWMNQQDRTSKFVMRLWLAHPSLPNPPSMPEASTADVALRRLQHFIVRPGGTYRWKLVRDGKTVVSGKVTPDAANLLTIPRLTLTTTAADLIVNIEKP